jgi:excisionase family DNA binding protein
MATKAKNGTSKASPVARRLLTRDEAADYLGVSRGTLSRWAADRSGPAFVKLGSGITGSVRYAIEALDEFIDSRVCNPKQEPTR